jgi:homoaconitase/3-isopropylmalate dehydratase large subunit
LETGALARAIKMDKATSDHAEVYQSNDGAPYATEVQIGNPAKHLPPRLAFPMNPDGSARPWTYGQIKAAAERAVEAKL